MNLQPHPEYKSILQVLRRARSSTRSWSGILYRSVTLKYAGSKDLLSGAGSRMNGGRWNPPGSFPVVYASTTPEAAMSECLASFRYYSIPLPRAMPRLFVAIEAKLHRILDMTNERALSALGLTVGALLREDWRGENDAGREARTQAIGRAALAVKMEGLIVPSAAKPDSSNVAVFPTGLLKKSTLRLEGNRV